MNSASSSSSSLPITPAGEKGSTEAPPPLPVTGQPLDGAPAVVHVLHFRFHSSSPGCLHSSSPGCLNSSSPGCLHSSSPGCLHSSSPGCLHSSSPGCLHSSSPGCLGSTTPLLSLWGPVDFNFGDGVGILAQHMHNPAPSLPGYGGLHILLLAPC